MEKEEKKAFNNWKTNAFHLTFPNGNWISTTWDIGTYSDNLDADYGDYSFPRKSMPSNTCEIMIDCPEKLSKKIHRKFDGDGSIIQNLNITQWLEILRMISK